VVVTLAFFGQRPPFYQMPRPQPTLQPPRGDNAAMQWTPWQHPTDAGFTLRGWHTRPRGKPLLHFLHGNGFCGLAYEPLLKHLHPHYDLWLSDAQGHGQSDHGGRFVGWNRSAELAMAALHAQGKAFSDVPHFGLGHSFGGVLTALILGSREHRFERAVLMDPVIMPPAMLFGLSMASIAGLAQHAPLARQARGRRHHWPSREVAFAQLHGRGVYKGWADEALQAFVDHALKADEQGGVTLCCQPSREAEVFSTGPERLWAQLGRVRTPTTVLQAQHTFPFARDGVKQWELVNSSVNVVVQPGGHCFMQEDPASAARAVLSGLACG
jgi:pimeloyl-ACP methyl ester carboxylesterase